MRRSQGVGVIMKEDVQLTPTAKTAKKTDTVALTAVAEVWNAN